MASQLYRLSLRVMEGPHAGRVIRVPCLPFLIGRAPDCHLRPGSRTIGERHCVLTEGRNGTLVLRDLEGSTGTFVNGDRIAGETYVGDMDELGIGPFRLTLLVEQQPAPPVAAEESSAPEAR